MTPIKIFFGNASGSQSFTIREPTHEDRTLLGEVLYQLVRYGSDTTWQIGNDLQEVPTGTDYDGYSTGREILQSVLKWVA